MSIEDRVRTATRDRAHLVRAIRPLDLPAAQAARPARAPWARGWSAWMAPVTAAAVVVALAITLVSVREVRNEPSVPPAATAPAGTGATAAAAVLPRYYAALDDPSGAAFNDKLITQPVDVVVGDTSTGHRIATVAPVKRQTFVGLTAAADDRTFVLAAASRPRSVGIPSAAPVAWYLLHLAPGSGRPATLTRLSIPGQPPGTQVSGIALSPDGGELAVLYQRGVWSGNGGKTGPLTLSVYSVSTGQALRTWTQPTNGVPAGYGWYWGRYSNSSITWLADGHTLAFADGINSGGNAPPLGAAFSNVKIRTLDLSRPGGDLLADSKVVFSVENHWCDTLQLTADGKSVLCGSYGGAYGGTGNWGSAYNPEILEYSVATGKSRVVYRFTIGANLGLADVLWASRDGSTLLGSALGQQRQGSRVIASVAAVGLIAKGALKPANVKLAGTPFAGQIAL